MARRAGGSTIVGPKELTAEEMDQRLEEQLAQLRGQAEEGRAERERMDEEFGPTEGLLPSDDLEQRLVTETTADPSQVDLAPPQAQQGIDEDPRAAQREAERVPGLLERTGIQPAQQGETVGLLGVEESLGHDMTNRLRGFADTISNQLDPISLPIKQATDMDPNNPLFDSQLEKFNRDDKETTMRMNKGPSSLALTKSNLLLSRQGLGIGQWNPKWNPAEVDIDGDGKLTNYNDLTTTQPAIINPVYGLAIASVIEPFMLQQEAMGATQEVEAQRGRPQEMEQDFSMQGLGRELFKGVRKMRSEMEGESSDAYVQDYNNMTPEAFELLGKWGMDTYAQANPNMVTILPGQKGEATRGYALTREGFETLEKEVHKYRPVDFDYPLMVSKSPTGGMEFEGSLARTSTGQNPNPDPDVVQEAKQNAHEVDVVFDNQRSKIALMFGSYAFATNPISSGRGTGGNYTHNAFDLGEQRYNKILGIAKKQETIVQKKQIALKEAQAAYTENPLPFLMYKINKLKEDITFRQELVRKFSDPNVLRNLYYQNANKHLEVLVNLAKYDGQVFHYSYFNQKATQRLTTHQNKMSFQNSHLVRNIVGSGVKYQIQPRSGSPMEKNFLENMGYLFFDGAGLIPEASVKNAREHMYGRTPRYNKLVAIGTKIKNALDNYDPTATQNQLKNVKSTPKGISGVDGIKATLPQVLLQDMDVKSFLESITNENDSHKHFIQVVDYLVELAKYDAAVKSGSSFHTSINAIEIDGISNGLASMFAALGMESKLYRVGVKRAAGQEKILGNFKDIPNRDAYEGDIRDTLQENLEEIMNGEVGSTVLHDAAWMRKYGYNEAQVDMLRDMITLASEDKGNFRKMPLMTFSYGQELQNLIDSVYDTILSNPELETLIKSDFPGGVPKAAEFLNDFRNQAIELTLGNEITNFASSLKRFVEVSALYGRPVTLDSPSGGKVSFGGFVTKDDPTRSTYKTQAAAPVDTSGRRLNRKKLEAQLEKTTDPKRKAAIQKQIDRIPPETKVVVTPKVREFTPYAEKQGMIGARARGSILIAFGQGYDGATMLNVFAGKNWQNITRENKGKGPFVLPIYDAIVTDLGSMTASRRAINNSWLDLTTSGGVLKSLEKNVIGNVHFGRKDYMGKNLKSAIDMEADGDLVKWVASKLVRLSTANPDVKETGRTFRDRLLEETATYGDLVAAQEFLLRNEYTIDGQSPQEQVGKLVRDAIKNSRKAAQNIKKDYDVMGTEAEVLQYAADDLKLSKVLKAFDEQ